MKSPVKRKTNPRAIVPGADRYAPYKIADIVAIQALFNGTASEDEQRRAYRWIVESAAGVRNVSYVKGDPHDTAFNEGRRFVGLEISKLAAMDLNQAREANG